MFFFISTSILRIFPLVLKKERGLKLCVCYIPCPLNQPYYKQVLTDRVMSPYTLVGRHHDAPKYRNHVMKSQRESTNAPSFPLYRLLPSFHPLLPDVNPSLPYTWYAIHIASLSIMICRIKNTGLSQRESFVMT